MEQLSYGRTRSAVVAHTVCHDTAGVKEVSFSNDVRTSSDNGAAAAGLTVGELVAVAICSVLLGLMYVASVLLYLHVRKGRAAKGRNGDPEAFKNPLMSNGGGGVIEEGVIKNNPLLMQQHGYNDNEAYESDDDGGGGGRHYGTTGQPRGDTVATAVTAADFAADVNHVSIDGFGERTITDRVARLDV